MTTSIMWVLVIAIVGMVFVVTASMITGVDGALRTACIGVVAAAVGAVGGYLAKRKGK